ncbi:transglutaminase TgpA family protein [Halobellus inordinatus]|uniref:transglutaminase TgpA family protein n=1 Tax=Halobellus inordinatus TaxID=1126236 RepID=UPI0021155B7A|nr:transglutaminaseTgpA domain-containing protein [Halobellus ramosii]
MSSGVGRDAPSLGGSQSGRSDRSDGSETAGFVSDIDGSRALAVVSLLALTWSYAGVLWRVTDVVGGSTEFAVVVAGAIAFAVLVGRFVGVRVAFVVTSLLLGLGLAVYLFTLPQSQIQLLTPERALSDTVALLTGLSVLRLVGAGVWAMAVVPGPVFLSWYLTVRKRYVSAAVAGGVALGLVVLTGDAEGVATLVGVVGATGLLAASTFDRHGTAVGQADVLTVLLAAMIVAASTLSVVPGAAGSPILPDRGAPTVEASLVDADDSVEIVGSIRLSPSVRFTVDSPRAEYWQTAAYDRYTGSGWVRTGNERPYDGRLRGPPGPSRRLEQTVTAEDPISILPAAWRPVDLDGPVRSSALVTPQGNVRPGGTLQAGETFTVTSRVPNATSERLRRAGTDYPDRVTEAYLQLPESTTQRVRERAESVAGDAETPYAKAVAIEAHLESSKEYSLSVPAPSGDAADTFLFEMDAGYCTYYATTMVVMLRSQGVPARFVTGYTPGENVGNDSYVVRGLNSHAWVEVYFPDVGWVRFDPTPSGPRETAENTRLTEARQNEEENIDLPGPNETVTPPPGAGIENQTPAVSGAPGGSTPAGVTATTPASATSAATADATDTSSAPIGGGIPVPNLPSGRTLLVGAVALVGLTAGAHRTGAADRTVRLLAIQYQRRRDPEADVARAYRRLEGVLEREYRPRRRGETPRSYLQSVPLTEQFEDARRVGEYYERARYGDGVSAAEADEAVSTVDRLVRSSTPLLRWFQ